MCTLYTFVRRMPRVRQHDDQGIRSLRRRPGNDIGCKIDCGVASFDVALGLTVGTLDGDVPELHFAVCHVVSGVVQAKLHAHHLGIPVPRNRLQVARPLGFALDCPRDLHLFQSGTGFTRETHEDLLVEWLFEYQV